MTNVKKHILNLTLKNKIRPEAGRSSNATVGAKGFNLRCINLAIAALTARS